MNEYGQPPSRGCWAVIASIFRGVDLARRIVLNLIFLFLFLGLIALTAEEVVLVPEKAALVIMPEGPIVEQLSGDPVDRAVEKMLGEEEPEVLLRDLQLAIAEARDDERVQALVLQLDALGPTHITKLQAVAESIEDFKQSGKRVFAVGDGFDSAGYYLAAHADEIHLHEMGMVFLEGYGRFQTYYKDGIDRLEIDWNVFRVGEYKSAVEPYLRDDMSDEAKEANLDWLGDLWDSWITDVAAARGIEPAVLRERIEGFADAMSEHDGSAAEVALAYGLVDAIGWRDGYLDVIAEVVGRDEEGDHSYHRIAYEDYLHALGKGSEVEPLTLPDEAVAVLVASGVILDGTQPPGTIGGDSTAALIRDARYDEGIKALVLRVDSGGGSAFASEVIRRELQLTREAGKPVVVSMGSYAASGGYWIATASDEIWAGPNTVTGSIGIFGMFPTFQKPMAKYLGMRVDGVGTTPLSGSLRPDRALAPEAGEVIQQMIERGYRDFLDRVAEARGMSVEEVDVIARGRVWSGVDALEHGLVDQLGDLDDAIASAGRLAELGEEPAVRYLEPVSDFQDRWLVELLGFASDRLGLARVNASRAAHSPLISMWRRFLESRFKDFASFNDPRGIYAHCLCQVD